ncbi:long-chain fatty acid--CoA ligase [Aquabacterium lacunae]|uniref:Long-chain-fatty-acid--CoA ligase n=1 Tax=Aquabacterium lacunae TaxID=2528630 RepID=A0A4Q9GVU6_9BURK|nr:AMP-binding protein [Aquabacterium lacunae]TBO28817.1 long-chain fatty acid--CoA ligase [Aquabacterium lacunae]
MTQASAAATPPAQSLVNPDGTTNRIWLKEYVKGVAHDIDLNKYQSLNDYFDECVNKFRDRPGFVSIGTEMSNDLFERRVKAFAGFLQSKGVKKGDRVAIMLPNTLQYPITLFAVLRLGAVVVNVNPLYTARELQHTLKDSGAETIIVMETFAKTLEEAKSGTQLKTVVLTQIGDLLAEGWFNPKGWALNFVLRHVQKMVPAYSLPGAIWYREALAQGEKVALKPVKVHQQDLAFLQYTGGTTGVAKGAMLTHLNVLANCQQALAFAEGQLTGETETVVTLIPMYHIFSLTVNGLIFMALGGRNILIANPRDTKRVMMILKNEKFSGITGVNTLFASFLDDPAFAKLNFSKLKLSIAGGMALQRNVAERWKEVTKTSIVEGYGLTECSPIVTQAPVDISKEQPTFTGSIGVPIPSTEVRCRRDDGSWADIGEPGELCVRGPQVMKGYWQRPEETAKVLDSEGWLATGDVAVCDERGYFKIVDRKKDMILVSGFNVYPNEIEDVVASHPGVKECAAIGVPDPVAGERVKIVIVPRDPSLTKESVLEHCRKNMTGYKIPRIVEFRTTELPKSPVGKILRREIRDGK